MEKFISLKEIIKLAKKEGIDLGKGDPYNRLRYYTKMGWLPHMIRKANSKGDIEGHYPLWAMDTLRNIQIFKNEGVSNEQIDQRVKKQNNIKKTTLLFSDKDTQKKLVIYLAIAVLIIIIISELFIIKTGKPKNPVIDEIALNTPNYIVESGTGILPKNSKTVYVKTLNAKITNRINITFKDNYSPASRYWVNYSNDQTGFTLETDAPVSNDSSFYWFIGN